ncbi:hypothetical protein [Natrinema thermotolerans]|uniref:hypothetical protein n=1 Tax=Natrinema thermotolerans TaxID=121872 RepID=UPI000678D01E|nr:hypothetical protein [Natrinema thermotolerans]QCC57364.1 hypothetical protein DVR14_01395 [Natrinema thermotolerans]
MPSDTDTTSQDASPDETPSDPLKIPDEHADDEASREAFRDGFARALLLVQSTTSNFLKLATIGAGQASDGREPPDASVDASGLADLMDEIDVDGGDTEEPDDDRPQQLGADNI